MTSTAAAGSPVDRAAAIAHLLAGRHDAAAEALRALVEAEPHAPNLRYDLGAALFACGQPEAAADAWGTARAIHGLALLRELGVDMDRFVSDADHAAETGRGLMANGLPGVAAVALARTLEAHGPQAQIVADYAVCLLHQGAIEEACEVLGMARPEEAASLNPLLMAAYAFFDDGGLRRSLLARQAAAEIEAATPKAGQVQPAGAAEGPLKVGYIAGASPLDPRFLAVIARHDPEVVRSALLVEEDVGAPEGFTAFSIGGLSDAEAAEAVASFGFDLLVDLSGPAGGRMGLFARRPAPVQISWSSDLATTGLRAIDAKLMPKGAIDLDASMLFSESLIAMGPVLAPWPQVEIGPRSAGGRFTVGAFMAPALLNAEVVAALSRVVLSRPDACLMLKHSVMDDPVIQRVLAARFLACGVPRERLDFRGAAGAELDQFDFDDTDLAIDSRPSMGEAQLLSLLARGVPVLCAGGPTTRGRLNIAPLRALGLRELIVDDLDAAATRAIALAADPDAIAAIRAKIEDAFAVSAYGESAKVARALETAFREAVDRRARQSRSLKDLLSRAG